MRLYEAVASDFGVVALRIQPVQMGQEVKRRFVTDEMRSQMRELEKQGKSRKAIAEQLDLDAATVTRHLGPVRPYRGSRVPSGAFA